MFYLQTGSQDPYYNLAFEETVLLCRRSGDYLLLWQNDNTVVIGLNQNAEAEIDRPFVEAHGIRVVRRTTGGGAVYHDLGNLNYSFITDADGDLAMDRFTRPVVRALRELGLAAEATGRNDILVSGKKVSGTAQRILHGRILHHGTLLFDTDPAMVAGALRADPEKFASKGVRSVRGRVGNIRPLLPADMTLEAFWEHIKTALARDGLVPAALTAEELAQVRALREEKYARWDWNFGRSPRYTVSGRARFSGGGLEFQADVAEGRIRDIHFYGDFMARTSLDPLREALAGCPWEREAVGAALDRFPLADLFGTIGRSEILDTLFYPAGGRPAF